MIQVRRVIGILTSIMVVCGGAVALQTRAADEQHAPGAGRDKAASTAGLPAAKSARPDAGGVATARVEGRPDAGAVGSGRGDARPGAPQVPEESATIRDDPTIAPDPKQSADNNVSFPNDI